MSPQVVQELRASVSWAQRERDGEEAVHTIGPVKLNAKVMRGVVSIHQDDRITNGFGTDFLVHGFIAD